jgi:hypothetical protein
LRGVLSKQFISSSHGDRPLNFTVFVFSSMSLAMTFLVLALAREIRLRRGLRQLFTKLLAHWRSHHADDRSPD